jgi:dTMP kinase
MADSKGSSPHPGETGSPPSSFARTEETLQIKPTVYKDLLRNRDFLLLWLGQMVSAMGDWIIVAVLFAFVDQLSGGKSYAISLMMLCKFLPAILLGFLAGIIIDRLDRKRTLMLCDFCRAGLVILFPFSTNLLMVCILVFIIETFTIIYGPAKDASIPDLVEPDQLMNANSLNMLTLYASMAFGTAIAGTIIAFISWLGRLNPGFIGRHVDPNKAAFFIDSLTFLVSAYLIFRIRGFRKVSPEERVKLSTSQVREDFREGVRYLWHHELTRIVLVLTLACFLGGGTIYVLAVGFVKYVLGGSNSTFMYILTTLLFGMMGGSMLAGLLRDRLKKEHLMGKAIAGFGLGVIAFSLVTAEWLSFTLVLAGGICMGYATVGMVTLLHERLDEEFRGRAFATIQVIMRASIFMSIMIAGPLADLINALGRKLGFSPLHFFIFRVGGSFAGDVDGKVVDFRYLLNGPQIILFVGGIVILAAGIYGQRAFNRYFAGEVREPPVSVVGTVEGDMERAGEETGGSAVPSPDEGGAPRPHGESTGEAARGERRRKG